MSFCPNTRTKRKHMIPGSPESLSALRLLLQQRRGRGTGQRVRADHRGTGARRTRLQEPRELYQYHDLSLQGLLTAPNNIILHVRVCMCACVCVCVCV